MMKFIIITGGVCSGVGKGVVTSSLGALLKGCGLNISAIKIDPYLNPDAGLMSPREHGEVFVMDDGSEVDLDLGNYERYLDTTMTKNNNITTGKVFHEIYQRERSGLYLGKTVRIVPDVTNFIKDWIRETAKKAEADICLIELGGTIGDIEGVNFIEALREIREEEEESNVLIIEVDYLFEVSGELKTKPVQMGIKNARRDGLRPDILVCRSNHEMKLESLEKISQASGIPFKRIINLNQLNSVYRVPCFLEERGILSEISDILKLHLHVSEECLTKWKQISRISLEAELVINIALVGKYVQWPDTYTSITKALEHACYKMGARPKLHMIPSEDLEKERDEIPYNDAWSTLKSCSCLIVPGGFDSRGTVGMMNAIRWARENKVPFLGICFGFQLAVLEHARNVLSMTLANSEEFGSLNSQSVIIEMLEYQDPERKLGGTMRLGLKRARFTKKSILRDIYGTDEINERHRHRYEVNPQLSSELERSGLKFVAQNDDGTRMIVLELEQDLHPFFVGVQFHPEYLSRPFKPSPPFVGLVTAARQYQKD